MKNKRKTYTNRILKCNKTSDKINKAKKKINKNKYQ